jgi:hypothetical protein
MHQRYDILLVGTGCQFRDDPPISLVNMLCGDDIAQGSAIVQNGCGSVVTGGFNGENIYVLGVHWVIWYKIWLCKGKK